LINDTTLKRQNSTNELSSGVVPAPNLQASSGVEEAYSLAEKIATVVASERASFHTPGHKGRPQAFGKDEHFAFSIAHDVTELPGLDDLTHPHCVLFALENRLASLFRARRSFISVNGASACLMSALMAAASLGRRILIPANAHRSAVAGLTLANLEPVWFKPDWNADYGFYQQVSLQTVEHALAQNDVSALLIVSPTYQGAISDIAAISSLCKKKGVLLIVDEAHGAHLIAPDFLPVSALECGADIVVHSLHKTLPGLTQTGALHIAHDSQFSLDHVRALLSTVQSSSPSYQLMASIEQLVDFVSGEKGLARLQSVTELSQKLRVAVEKLGSFEVFTQAAVHEPLHVLVRPRFQVDLAKQLGERGVGVEAVFNQSVLLLFGLGSQTEDIETLVDALSDIAASSDRSAVVTQKQDAPPLFRQVLSPAEALRAPSQVVPIEDALGRICVECIAPCPPGTPVVVPGQIIEKQNLAYMLEFTGIRSLRVAQK
jgi:arginine decarboxylase